MFTGIVEEMGIITRVRRGDVWQLTLRADKVMQDLKVGDSVSVNGVCLTVTQIKDLSFGVEVSSETLRRSDLAGASSGIKVNLERAVRAQDRLGGHLVSGHVDGVGTIARRTKRAGAEIVRIKASKNILRYIVSQGSVAVDGISLTVLETYPDGFSVSVIPYTALVTTLASKKIGAKVNIEVDVVGKYLEKFFTAKARDYQGK